MSLTHDTDRSFSISVTGGTNITVSEHDDGYYSFLDQYGNTRYLKDDENGNLKRLMDAAQDNVGSGSAASNGRTDA